MSEHWDYTRRAATYDARAAYSDACIDSLVHAMGCRPWEPWPISEQARESSPSRFWIEA